MALPGFYELSVSANRTKNNLGIPLIQILRSWSNSSEYEFESYRDFVSIMEKTRDEAYQIIKYQKRNCFISNSVDSKFRQNVSDLDISILFVLALENRFENNIISFKVLKERYFFDRNTYKNQINKLKGLEFSCYSLHYKEFLCHQRVLDYISYANGFIYFRFSDIFSEFFLKSGKKLYIPCSALISDRYTRNAFFTMSHIYFFLNDKIQGAIKSGLNKHIRVTFGMMDYLILCGLDFKTRLDQMLLIISDVFMSFFCTKPQYIKNIIVNNNINFSKKSFFDNSDNALDLFLSSFRTKDSLLASSISVIFDSTTDD